MNDLGNARDLGGRRRNLAAVLASDQEVDVFAKTSRCGHGMQGGGVQLVVVMLG